MTVPNGRRARLGPVIAIVILLIGATVAIAAAVLFLPGLRSALGLPGGARVSYANPVLDQDFPDPGVLRTTDGWYYAYATQSFVDGADVNIQVARSRDLASWEHLGDALPEKPGWANTTQDFWAPHVSQRDGRFVMYYSARPDPVGTTDTDPGLCLAVATANAPEGPFTDVGQAFGCGPGFENIDPMAFRDPRDGRWLLYWGSGFGPIKVQELAADGLSFAAGSSPTTLVEANCFYDYSCLVEGAWVTYKEPYYYLYYSGDSCCEPVNYAVLVARSESPTGPFMTLEQSTDEPDSVILEKDADWIGPGHNSLVTDASGHEWIVYHAVDVDHFFLDTGDPAERFVRRPMLIEPVGYVDGWPRIGDGTPSGAPSPASPQP